MILASFPPALQCPLRPLKLCSKITNVSLESHFTQRTFFLLFDYFSCSRSKLVPLTINQKTLLKIELFCRGFSSVKSTNFTYVKD